MSLKQHLGISIIGLGNVEYPAFIELLQKAWDAKISSFVTLDYDLAGISSIKVGSEGQFITTSDGYKWYTWLIFQPDPNNSSSRLVFLLPWAKDFKKEDGSSSDRSIGVIEVGNEELIAKTVADPTVIKEICMALSSERKVEKIY